MVRSVILGRNKISGRAGSGIVIRREVNRIRDRVKKSIFDRNLGQARNYLTSIKGKGAYSRTNAYIDNLLNNLGGNVNNSRGRRDLLRRINRLSIPVLKEARQKAKASKRNLQRATAQNKARGLSRTKIKRTAGIITQKGVTYRIGASGGFERIGLSTSEKARRERIRSGKALARDLYKDLNVKKARDRQILLQRLQPALRQRAIQDAQARELATQKGRALLSTTPRTSQLRTKLTVTRGLEQFIPSGLSKSKKTSTLAKAYQKLARLSPNTYNAIVNIRKNRKAVAKAQKSKKTTKGQAQLVGLAFLDGLIQNAEGIINIPSVVSQVAKNPAIVTKMGGNLLDETKNFGVLIKTSPLEAIGRIGAELVVLKGTASAINKISQASDLALALSNPKFSGFARAGQRLKLKLPQGKVASVQVVSKIPLKSINSQLKLAGKNIDVAISSQGQALLGKVINRAKSIAKPLGATIPKSDKITTKLLKKLDKNNITRRELGILDSRLQSKYKIKGVLERSFFVDPSGKIRPSRLGLKDSFSSPTFLDIIKGNFTFKSPKPQILIFSNIQVEKFPAYLKPIVRKIKAGKKLNRVEMDKLLYFQTRQTGKFKPLGFVTRESELTLPQGSILKRVKTVGVTIIDGKRVPIVLTEVYNPTKAIKKAVVDYADGNLTKIQIKKLNKNLKKKTGIDYKLSSTSKSKKFLSLKKLKATGLLSASKYASASKKISKSSRLSKTSKTSRTSKGSKTSKTSRTSRLSKTSKTSRTSKGSKTSKTSRTSRLSKTSRTSKGSRAKSGIKSKPPIKPPIKLKLLKTNFDSKKLDNRVLKFQAKYRERKNPKKRTSKSNPIVTKTINLSDTKNRALKRVARLVDNKLSASLTLRVTNVGKSKKDIKKPTILKKFRSKKSKGTPVLRLVEKNKNRFDTKGEKRAIKRSRRKKRA